MSTQTGAKNWGHFLPRDLINYIPSKLIPAFVGLAVIIILSHRLSPDGYGKYAVILAIARLVNMLSFGWIRQSILRYYPEYQVDGAYQNFQEKTLGILMQICIFSSIVASVAILLLGFNLIELGVMLSVLIPLTLFGYLVTLYQSCRFSKRYAYVNIIHSMIQIVWVICFVYLMEKGYYFALLSFSVGYICAIVYIVVTSKQTNIFFKFKIKHVDYKFLKKILEYGVPMSFWLLSFQMIFQANKLIIRSMRSDAEVGIYSSAYDLIKGSLSLLMTPFLLAVHPLIMSIWAQNRNRYEIEALLKRVFRYLFILFSPIFIFSIFIRENIFVIFGQGYGVVGWVVPVLVGAAFLSQFSMYVHKGLEVAARTHIMLYVGMLTVFLNILFNLLFVSKYGYQASAIIMVASYIFYSIVIYMFSRQYIKLFFPWRTILRIGIAGCISTICLVGILELINKNLFGIILSGLIGIFVYIALLKFMGELDSEINSLKRLLLNKFSSIK